MLETTSLAIINWLNQDPSGFSKEIDLSVGFLLKSIKDGGRFGSTQATVLSLKALARYSKIYQGIKGTGTFVLYTNGIKIMDIPFDQNKNSSKRIDFSDALNAFVADQKWKNFGADTKLEFKVVIEDYKPNERGEGFALSYMFQLDFKNQLPPSAEKAPISFSLWTAQQKKSGVKVGDIQLLKVTVENLSGKGQGMVVAVISTPSCLSIDLNQFELLKERGEIDNYEMSADKTLSTIYWTYLKKDETKSVTITRVRKFGSSIGDSVCQTRASQAYLYYQDEDKVWIK